VLKHLRLLKAVEGAKVAGIFSGVRIVELAQYVFVPGASVLMADQGAEVIKVEPPGTGDPYRSLRIGDGREVGVTNLAMEQNNRLKKSLALDLKSPEGREALLRLIETADVFLTSLRPKAIRALRLDVDDLRARNPKIIYARGNGLGFRGAEADKPGFDASAFWARGGMCYAMTRPGAQPTPPRPSLGDHAGSMGLAYGIAGALFKRATTGEPSVVETSLLATAVWMLSADVTYSQAPGYKVHGTQATRAPLKYAYTTKDGRIIQLMLLDPRPHWAPLCRMLGIDTLIDDARFVDNEARMQNADTLIEIIQARVGAKTWEEWRPQFEAWDAPWEMIRTIDDVARDPQVLENEMVFPMQLGDDRIRLVAGPVAFDGRAAPQQLIPSPKLGEQTEELLAELGYSKQAIDELRQRAVVQ
jgi:crotonobetainyl-CoA:carnitine CoA-transferase CaiB-like acyl-CoA transferase